MRFSNYNLELPIDGGVLLVNTLSRSVMELDSESFELFQEIAGGTFEDDGDPDFARFVGALRAGFFIVNDDFDELAYLRERVQSARFDPDELALVIAPTMGCNFACHYCFEDRRDAVMSQEAEEQLFGYVADRLPGRKSLAVQWFGGEPLKALDQVERISRRLIAMTRERGINYSSAIVTNAFLLSGGVPALLRELGIHSAQITLDGDKELHDRTRSAGGGRSSFETILGNIEAAAPYIDVKLRIHVAPFNVDRVKALLLDLSSRGVEKIVKEVYFAPLFHYKPAPQERQFKSDTKRFFDAESFAAVELELFAELKRLGMPMPDLLRAPFSVCTAVRENAAVVGPSGKLYKCYFELDKPSRSVGDLQNRMPASDKLNRWLDHEIARDDECKTCKFLPVCFGGCTHKWQEGADKGNICTRLKFNANGLLPLIYQGSENSP
jgi:uncharacterized protein